MKRQNIRRIPDYDENQIVTGVSVPHIEIEKNRRVSVEGVKGILEYDGNVVKIDCGNIVLKFTGDSMEIDSMQSERINICGNILSVEFFT